MLPHITDKAYDRPIVITFTMQQQVWALLSQVFGITSICTWLCAQLPQIYENWKLKSVEGLSPQFLGIWILGDLSGLIGCIMTGQEQFQTILSSYYVCTDLVLCLQYWHYRGEPPLVLEGVSAAVEGCNSNRSLHSKPVPFRKRLGSIAQFVGVAGSLSRASAAPLGLLKAEPSFGAQWLEAFSGPHIGYVCAYLSTCMYMVSRIPQIYHNMCRQSVEGVSPLLFCATLFGNIMYTASIVCVSYTQPDQRTFLLNELSYILGSVGTVLFDVVIFSQFYLYRKPSEPENIYFRRPFTTPLVLTHQVIYSSVGS